MTLERSCTRSSSLTTTGAQLPLLLSGLPHCPAPGMYNLMVFFYFKRSELGNVVGQSALNQSIDGMFLKYEEWRI